MVTKKITDFCIDTLGFNELTENEMASVSGGQRPAEPSSPRPSGSGCWRPSPSGGTTFTPGSCPPPPPGIPS